jgi:hypothetical protein
MCLCTLVHAWNETISTQYFHEHDEANIVLGNGIELLLTGRIPVIAPEPLVGPSAVPNTSRVSRPTTASEVRVTARSLMEPLERADHARCWFGLLLGAQGQCPNRGVYRKPADAFFAFTHWLNGARWCEVHRHDYDVEVDQ